MIVLKDECRLFIGTVTYGKEGSIEQERAEKIFDVNQAEVEGSQAGPRISP